MIKKIIALILTLSMLSALSVQVMANDDSTASDSSQYEAVMTSLGLMPEDYEAGSRMNREKFISYIIELLNLSRANNSDRTSPFSDVDNTNKYYSDIITAYDLGLVTGSEGKFNPKTKISYQEAVKLVVSILGYGSYAQLSGGYPVGYEVTAKRLNLTDGVTPDSKGYIIGSEILELCYNAVNTTILEEIGIEGGDIVYTDSKDVTFLGRYHGIERYEGQLRGYGSRIISGNYELSANELLIDGKTFKTVCENCVELLGMTVYYYYDDSAMAVIALEKSDTTGNVLVIVSDDIAGPPVADKLTYYVNDRTKTINISSDTDIVYNGRCTAYDPALFAFNDGDGEIKFIDSDGNGRYDIILVSEYINYVVAGSDKDIPKLYDIYDKSKTLTIADEETVVFIDEFGNDMYFEELKPYDVISTVVSKDGKAAELYYSNSESYGAVKEIANGNSMKFVVGDKELEVAKNFRQEAANIKIGDSGIFVLDIYGKIAAFKEGQVVDYAYLIQAGMDGNSLNSKLKFKMLTPDGEIRLYDAYDKIKVDEAPLTDSEILAKFPKSRLVIYRLNADGLVTSLDTCDDGGILEQTYTDYDQNDYSTVTASDDRLRWSKFAYVLSGKVVIDPSVIVFQVPKANQIAADDEYVTVPFTSTYFTDASYVGSIETYKSNKDSIASNVIIKYHDVGSLTETVDVKTPIAVVDKITTAINEEEEMVTKLYAYYNGNKYVSYEFKNGVNPAPFALEEGGTTSATVRKELTCGDIIRFELDTKDRIAAIELIYDREKSYLISSGTAYFIEDKYVIGDIYSRYDNYIEVAPAGSLENLSSSDVKPSTEIYRLYSGKILLYDSSQRENKICSIAFEDVKDWRNYGADYSKVVLWNMDGGATSVVVVYK